MKVMLQIDLPKGSLFEKNGILKDIKQDTLMLDLKV